MSKRPIPDNWEDATSRELLKAFAYGLFVLLFLIPTLPIWLPTYGLMVVGRSFYNDVVAHEGPTP